MDGIVTVSVGFHDAVLFPTMAVGVATTAGEVERAVVLGTTALTPVVVTTPVLYDTAEEAGPEPVVKVVDVAEAFQTVVLPRRSVTVTLPSWPEIEVAPEAPLVSAALDWTATLRPPPMRLNVVVVSPAAASAGVAVRRASVEALAAMAPRDPKCLHELLTGFLMSAACVSAERVIR